MADNPPEQVDQRRHQGDHAGRRFRGPLSRRRARHRVSVAGTDRVNWSRMVVTRDLVGAVEEGLATFDADPAPEPAAQLAAEARSGSVELGGRTACDAGPLADTLRHLDRTVGARVHT